LYHPDDNESASSSSIGGAIGGVIAGILLLIAIIALVMIVMLYIRQSRKKQVHSVNPKAHNIIYKSKHVHDTCVKLLAT